MKDEILCKVDGLEHALHEDPARRLSEVLRDAGYTSVKLGCDAGDCGACTVLIDGAQHCACLTPVAQVAQANVETLETCRADGQMQRLQASFLAHGAAQCGICTPGMMMAALELLRDVPRPNAAEVEGALGGVLCRCTGYRKIIDAVVGANKSLPKAPAAEVGKAVGARVQRLDGIPKVDGSEVFGADYVPEGVLAVRAIRSPFFHAGFAFGDIQSWQADQSCVACVLTSKDIDGENRFGVIPPFADQPALAEGRARFKGEAVALIVGDPDALEALDLKNFPITWAELPAALTEAEASADGAPLLHVERPKNTMVRGRVARGAPDVALRDATHVATGRFQTSYVEHAYIEPEAGVAWMEGDVLAIQACTQAPVMDQEETAKVLGLPKEKVRIIPAAAGGGFGSKLDLSVQPLIGLAALTTGKPCRMVWSRSESLQASTKRHPATMEATIGCDGEGRVTGMVFHGEFNTGAYASWGPTVASRVPIHASGPYKTPNYRATSRAVHSNGPSSGAFRGFGVPQAAICQEQLYDDLATACDMDRLAFRKVNALQDGDTSVCGQDMQGVGLFDCLEALEPHWLRISEEVAGFNSQNARVKRGLGVASCWYGCGNTALPNPSTIRIGITREGRVSLHQGATDIGQGSNTVITQIAADALRVAIEAFDLIGPDTALTPDCGKTSASRQTFITGKAAELAGAALREMVRRYTNLDRVDQITMSQGCLTASKGTETREIILTDLETNSLGYVFMAEESYDPPTSPLNEDGQGVPYAVYGYGAQIAEVEVNLDLGTTKVRHIVAAHDLGRVINPVLAEGQIEGGIAQGLGLALMEEYIPGRTENLHDYLIPTIGDVPPITSILVETPDPVGPMGAKGLGEHVLIPTAPAILNAIHHASGVRLGKVPALPHRVRAAIRDKEGPSS